MIQQKPSRRSAPAVPKKGSTGGLFGEQEPDQEKVPSDHQRVVAAWVKAYGKNHGGAVPTTQGRAGKANFAAIKELLASQGVDGAIAVIRAAYADENFEKYGGTLQRLASNPDKYKVAPAKKHSALYHRPFPFQDVGIDKEAVVPAPPETVAALQAMFDAKGSAIVDLDARWSPPPAGMLDGLLQKLDAAEAETVPEPYRAAVTGSEHADVQLPAFVNAAEIQAYRALIEDHEETLRREIVDEDDEERGERVQNAERGIYVARERIKDLDGTRDRERQAQADRDAERVRVNRELGARLRARRLAETPPPFDSSCFDGLEPVASASEVEERPSGMVPSAGLVKANLAPSRPVSEVTHVSGRGGA